MFAIGDDSGPCLRVRKPEPLLPSEHLVEAGCASRREEGNSPTRRNFVLQSLHGQPTDTLTLTFRVSSHCFDVADSAPRLVAESDQPRNSAGMSDEMVAVTYQHMHTAERVVSVIVVETVAESSAPQPHEVRARNIVKPVAFEHLDIHAPQPIPGAVPS